MKTYIVYDARAVSDLNKPVVIDVLGEMREEDAIKEVKSSWCYHDVCLVSYDSDGEGLINGRQVFY